jgi:uncharacterized protein (TIGR03435 family)
MYANGRSNPPWDVFEIPSEGGPSWIRSDQYTINAKAEGTPSIEMMQGPMLQALLEDRFNLKIHHETREVPVYLLTVAKGGSKLQRFKEGSCTRVSLAAFPPPPPAPGEKRCPWGSTRKGPNKVVEAQGITIEEFAKVFLGLRPVIDKTGIAGLFDFHFEVADRRLTADPATPSDEPLGPSISTVLEQLGLKLESSHGPGQFLVIDSVDRPTEN